MTDPRRAIPVQPIQPQARPLDSFVAQPAGNLPQSPLSQLAGALSSIQPAFERFNAVREVKEKTAAELAAEREFLRQDFETLDAAIRRGDLPEASSPYHLEAFMKVYGRELGERSAEKMLSAYEASFDKDNGDFDEFLQAQINDPLKGIDRPSIQSGYLDVVGKMADAVRRKHAAFKDGQKLEIKYKGVLSIINEAIRENPGDVEGAVDTIRQFTEGQGPRLLGLERAEVDSIVLIAAAEQAELGNVELVNKLLKDTRGKVGSIAGKANAQGKSARAIIKKAQKAREKIDAVALQELVSKFQTDAANGRLDRDAAARVAGENSTALPLGTLRALYFADDKARASNSRIEFAMEQADLGRWGLIRENFTEKERKDVDNRFLSKIAVEGKAKGLSEGQVFDDQVKFLVQNNATNSFWIDLFGTYGQANALNFAKGDKVPPQLNEAVNVYNKLYAANPGLLDRHIKDKRQREFYEMVRIQETRQSVERQDAMVNALTIQQTPDTAANAMRRQRQFDILRQAIDATMTKGEGGILFADNSVENSAYVGKTLENMAGISIRLGVAPKQSLETAKQQFLATHTNINGFMVFTGGRRVDPSDINEKARMAYASYLASNPDQFLTEDELTFTPVSPGSDGLWVVRVKATGMVAPGASNTGTFPLSGLNEIQIERKRAEVNADLDIRQDTSGRLEAIFDLTSGAGSPVQRRAAKARMARQDAEFTRSGHVTILPKIEADGSQTIEAEVKPDQRSFGIRNNNPGNIRAVVAAAKFNGQTGVSEEADGGFLKFDTPKAGIRALARILRTYRKRGVVTLRQIISTFSPPSENDTEGLIRAATKLTGISGSMEINVTDDAMMMRMLKIILKQEQSDIPYSDELLQSAINSAKRS